MTKKEETKTERKKKRTIFLLVRIVWIRRVPSLLNLGFDAALIATLIIRIAYRIPLIKQRLLGRLRIIGRAALARLIPASSRLRVILPQRLYELMSDTIAHAKRHDPHDEHAVKRQIVVHERVQTPLDRVLRVSQTNSRANIVISWAGRESIHPNAEVIAVSDAYYP